MALVSVSSPRGRKSEESTLDKILKAVKLTEGVLGIGLAIPEYIQKRKALTENRESSESASRLAREKASADFRTKFRPVSEEQAYTPAMEGISGADEMVDEEGKGTGQFTSVMAPPTEAKLKPGVFEADYPEMGIEGHWTPAKAGAAGLTPQRAVSIFQKTLPYDSEREYPTDSTVMDFGEGIGTRVIPPDPTQMRADERALRMAGYTAIGVRRGSSAVLGKAINREKLARNIRVLIAAAREGAKGSEAEMILNSPEKRAQLSPEDISRLQELAKHKFKPTKQFAYDVAMGLAAVMGGGNQPAYHLVEEMVPTYAKGDFKSLMQWITGDPQDYLNTEFLDHFDEAMVREIKFWGRERDNMIAGIAHFMDPVFTRNEKLLGSFTKGVEAAFHSQGNMYENWLQRNYKYKDTHKEYSVPAFRGSKMRVPKTDWSGDKLEVKDSGVDQEKLLEVQRVFSQSGQTPVTVDPGSLADALEGME